MIRRMKATSVADAAALARRQAILRQLEKLIRQRAVIDGSRIWKCPECRHVMRSDHDRQPHRGKTVCLRCHRNMELQPVG